MGTSSKERLYLLLLLCLVAKDSCLSSVFSALIESKSYMTKKKSTFVPTVVCHIFFSGLHQAKDYSIPVINREKAGSVCSLRVRAHVPLCSLPEHGLFQPRAHNDTYAFSHGVMTPHLIFNFISAHFYSLKLIFMCLHICSTPFYSIVL